MFPHAKFCSNSRDTSKRESLCGSAGLALGSVAADYLPSGSQGLERAIISSWVKSLQDGGICEQARGKRRRAHGRREAAGEWHWAHLCGRVHRRRGFSWLLPSVQGGCITVRLSRRAYRSALAWLRRSCSQTSTTENWGIVLTFDRCPRPNTRHVLYAGDNTAAQQH